MLISRLIWLRFIATWASLSLLVCSVSETVKAYAAWSRECPPRTRLVALCLAGVGHRDVVLEELSLPKRRHLVLKSLSPSLARNPCRTCSSLPSVHRSQAHTLLQSLAEAMRWLFGRAAAKYTLSSLKGPYPLVLPASCGSQEEGPASLGA